MPPKPHIPKQHQTLKGARQGQLFSVAVPSEKPQTSRAQTELEYIQLLKELVNAFQSIPQRYCIICRGKIRLGLAGHRPTCPVRRSAELVNPNRKRLLSDVAWREDHLSGFAGLVCF